MPNSREVSLQPRWPTLNATMGVINVPPVAKPTAVNDSAMLRFLLNHLLTAANVGASNPDTIPKPITPTKMKRYKP